MRLRTGDCAAGAGAPFGAGPEPFGVVAEACCAVAVAGDASVGGVAFGGVGDMTGPP